MELAEAPEVCALPRDICTFIEIIEKLGVIKTLRNELPTVKCLGC